MRVSIQQPEISAEQRRATSAAGLGTLLRTAGDALGVPARASLRVLLTTDAALQSLNERWMGIDAPTDVLAFPGGTRLDIGDLAISVDRAGAQSPDVPAELRLLAIHGLLHCLGHDHADAAPAAEMTRLTRRLLPGQAVPDLVAEPA